LKVRLTGPEKNHVLTRSGYFATPTAKPAAQSERQRAIDRAAAANDVLSQLPVRVVVQANKDNLRVILIVDVRQLKFAPEKSRRIQKLSFIAALFDENGRFVSGKEGNLDLALKDATFARFAETGVSTAVSLPAQPGAYRLRGVIEDSEGHMTTTLEDIQIR
jgi:hypothetical protein